MLEKAIDILKARWPEVMLLIILQAAMILLSEQIMRVSELSATQNAPLPFWASFVLGLGFIGGAIVWQMMYLGFLKTAAVEQEQPQQPMDLLRIGRPYFWRILFFQILIGLAAMLISNLIAMGIARLMNITDFPRWLIQIAGLVGTLVMIKPILVVTARIIVYDDTVLRSMLYITVYKLARIEDLLNYFISGISVVLVVTAAGTLVPEQGIYYYLYSAVHNIILSIFLLIPTLAVVLWFQAIYSSEYQQANEDTQA